MQTFFDIGSFKVINNAEAVLLWEIGTNYSLLSLWDEDMKTCRHVQVNMFDEIEMEESLKQIIFPYKDAGLHLKKVVVCSAFPDALLVPKNYFAQDNNLLNLVYDVQLNRQFYDFAGQWQVVNFYAIPAPVLQIISEQFPFVSFRHVYTPSLKISNGVEAANQLNVHFTNNQFRVLVKKANELQLMQTYSFIAPLDVVYYLLKICNEFELPQDETHLILSGFVESDSAIFKELYQYFLNIYFAKQADINMPEHHYPQHFFTSLYNLAACVS